MAAEIPRACAHEKLGRYSFSEELWEPVWFGSLKTCPTACGQEVVNYYVHLILSETIW